MKIYRQYTFNTIYTILNIAFKDNVNQKDVYIGEIKHI